MLLVALLAKYFSYKSRVRLVQVFIKTENIVFSQKWHDLTWPGTGPKFNLPHLQEISTTFKLVVLTPKLGIGISLIRKFCFKLTILFLLDQICQKRVLFPV